MTPEAIVDTAISKGHSIISITDHNEIQNSNTAINHSIEKAMLVIPGIEVNKTQGHVLSFESHYLNFALQIIIVTSLLWKNRCQ
jgi:predicted metal-dependent phosphoesterase TrpH